MNHMPPSTPPPERRMRREGGANVRHYHDVIEVRFFDFVSRAGTERSVTEVTAILKRAEPKFFVIDTLDATGYSPDVRTPGVALLRAMKGPKLIAGFCIASSSAIRMIGSAVAFVASVHVAFVESRDDASTIMERMRNAESRFGRSS